LFDSIVKGDTIMVIGKLKQREYEKDGEKRTVMEIRADSIGVSTRWGPAKTVASLAASGGAAAAKDALGAVEIEQTEAPF
jgi:single-strand DNA-binding protein